MKSKKGAPFRPGQSLKKKLASPFPSAAGSLLQKALTHHQIGQLPQAETLYRQILQVSPDHPDALHLLGMLASQVEKYATGLELINRAILCKPNFAEAYNTRGNTLHALHQYQAALESFDKAILLRPNYAEAYSNRSNPLQGLQLYQAALESCNQAIFSNPSHAEAHNNRGNVLLALQLFQSALESCDQAILLKPHYAQAYGNRGSALQGLQQYQAAVESYDQAILLNPDNAEDHSNRGVALHALQQYQAALASYDQAILLRPDHAEAFSNRGSTLFRLEHYQASLESCERAILLKPDFAEAYHNRGSALNLLQQYPAALESFEKALLLKPGYEYLRGTRLHLQQVMCDWEDIESQFLDLEARLDRGEKVTPPLQLLSISSFPALQRKAAEIFADDYYPSCRIPEAMAIRPRRDRIRIGYFSADFRAHPICHLMAELFERHDRSRFELLGFSFDHDENDEMRIRVTAAMDRFLNVQFLSETEVAGLSRELEVDIAVDLMGFTGSSRTGIFAQRAAPIQVNYLGYPGTMGAKYFDYIIADPTLIPEANQRYYSEKIAYLPDSFQANDSTHLPSPSPRSRDGEGLPERGFVYCCFNNNHKITPAVFDIWMRILERVDGSVLWLLEANAWAGDNLRKQAMRRGISAERLTFARRLPICEHLARLPLADLFLDTLPFNAGATASPTLWAGVPLLTCMGEAFASRMGASLLRALGMPDLVTATHADYEALAVALALDKERYHEVRERLRRNRLTAPLFDVPRFTRYLEAAYSAMYERHQSDLRPEHIHIARFQ
jgi:predicted O-linked N-acetylglucosamine transferase (SPINDLY family)